MGHVSVCMLNAAKTSNINRSRARFATFLSICCCTVTGICFRFFFRVRCMCVCVCVCLCVCDGEFADNTATDDVCITDKTGSCAEECVCKCACVFVCVCVLADLRARLLRGLRCGRDCTWTAPMLYDEDEDLEEEAIDGVRLCVFISQSVKSTCNHPYEHDSNLHSQSKQVNFLKTIISTPTLHYTVGAESSSQKNRNPVTDFQLCHMQSSTSVNVQGKCRSVIMLAKLLKHSQDVAEKSHKWTRKSGMPELHEIYNVHFRQ